MPFQSKDRLTFARQFLEPVNSNHRLYEALRAYFVEQRPAAEVAQQFGYTAASVRVMAHEFRKNPERDFFLPSGREIVVRFQKRAHNPLLLAAGFGNTDIPVPWLGRKRLQFMFG